MAGITLHTARQVVPMIYAYTTPEIARHNGWTKIGYTEQSVDKRLKQQTHTADVLYHEEWRGNAVYDDGSGEVFTDHDFHAYLRKLNVENDRKNEWFHLDGEQSRRYFQDFRMNRGRVKLDAAIPYILRKEQAEAVAQTKAYCQSHPGGEFLWNAKPRFGKTLSVYDFCKQVDAQTVLIVTNRPAIANSWYSDYVRFLGRESGYLFVSHVDALAGQPHVLDEQGYLDAAAQGEELYKRIEFVSLQDMKGSKYFGGEYDKLRHLTELNWDVLVIDEAHEGVDTYKTDLAFDRIRRRFTLHLSGSLSRRWRTTSLPGTPSSTGPTPTSRQPSGTGRAHRGSRTPTPISPCSTSTPTRCPRSSGTKFSRGWRSTAKRRNLPLT